jgi:hypothetical protein
MPTTGPNAAGIQIYSGFTPSRTAQPGEYEFVHAACAQVWWLKLFNKKVPSFELQVSSSKNEPETRNT